MLIAIRVISFLFQAYEFLILIRVLLSWVSINPYGSGVGYTLVRLLYRITEPVLAPVRRLIPAIGGAIDISPMIVLIGLEILRQVVIRILISL